MNTLQIRASLALHQRRQATWTAKEKFRRSKLNFYRKVSKRPWSQRENLIVNWREEVQEAARGVATEGKIVAREKHRLLARSRPNKAAAARTTGVTHFDGIPVANWLVPYLEWGRAHGWHGRLVSGWRDPVYSEGLCLRMCGARSCPGRCAGRSSNHSGSEKPHGAVDVSDFYTFGRVMQSCPLAPKLINRLGAQDPVHFSQSGN